MAALDEDDAAQRRRRKQRHEGETTMEDGDVSEHGQEIFEPFRAGASGTQLDTSASMFCEIPWRASRPQTSGENSTTSRPQI